MRCILSGLTCKHQRLTFKAVARNFSSTCLSIEFVPVIEKQPDTAHQMWNIMPMTIMKLHTNEAPSVIDAQSSCFLMHMLLLFLHYSNICNLKSTHPRPGNTAHSHLVPKLISLEWLWYQGCQFGGNTSPPCEPFQKRKQESERYWGSTQDCS